MDRLHVKRNRIVGMNYLGIIDYMYGVVVNNCREVAGVVVQFNEANGNIQPS